MVLYLRRVAVLLLLVLAPLPVAASPAWACSCATDFDPLERSELAFEGVVEDIDASWTSQEVEVEFTVDSVIKGDAGGSVTLVTSENSASCGYEFVAGSQYRVYANDGETSLCDGNELLAAGNGAGPTRTVWVGSIVAFVLVVMGGAVIWLARRSRRKP